MPACLDVVRGWQCCHWWLAVSFLPLLRVVAVGVNYCRVVPLVAVLLVRRRVWLLLLGIPALLLLVCPRVG